MKKKNQAPAGAVAKQYFGPEAEAKVEEIISADAPVAKKAKKSAPAPEPTPEPEAPAPVVEEPKAEEPAPAPEPAPEPPSEDAQ